MRKKKVQPQRRPDTLVNRLKPEQTLPTNDDTCDGLLFTVR